MGAALLGATVGSWVQYAAPNGELKVLILDVGPA
jgi:transcription elongation GreA/GreB family factor